MTNPYSAPEAPLNQTSGPETYQPTMFQWRGRIGRLRYLAYTLGLSLVTTVPLLVIQLAATTPGSTAFLVLQGLIAVIGIAVTVVLGRRRFNDMGYRGWQVIGLIIPIVNIIVGLWVVFAPGDAQPNRYGPPPAPNSTGVVVGALLLPVLAVVAIVVGLSVGAYSGFANRGASQSSQSF